MHSYKPQARPCEAQGALTEIRQLQKSYSLKTGTYRAKASLWHYT
jgi:hypothetical protein